MSEKNTNRKAEAVTVEEPNESVHTVVVDGSSFTFIDSMGLHALPSVSISVPLAPIHSV